ncbi:MAG: hypothetical protein RR496_01625 [Lachnospiraceae bacterium]
MTLYYYMLYFFIYGFLGWCTEVAFAAVKSKQFVNRGFLNGPICPIYGIGVGIVVALLSSYRNNLIALYVASVIVVTVLEWVTGLVLEKVFHDKWWDYSEMPLNLNGYVCLLFSMIWGVACVVIVDFIHPLIHRGLAFVPKIVGIIVLVMFSIIIVIDLYVTVSGILKLNKRLERMSIIANELHNLSEQLGENIYKGIADTVEREEATKKKLDVASQEMRERATELKRRYQELSAGYSKVHKRLIDAFPKMQSKRYKEALRDIQKKQWAKFRK